MTYRLSRHGRESYDQQILTDPPIEVWSASFDGGVTWDPGAAIAGEVGWFRWLIAGDLAEPGAAVVQLTPTGDRDLVPLARGEAGTELVVRKLEGIRVE